MKAALVIIILLLNSKILLASNLGSANPKNEETKTDSKKIYRSFAADEEGLQSILDELKEEKPAIYAKVKKRGEGLISDIKTAKYISYGTAIVGTAAVISGFSKMGNETDSSGNKQSEGFTLMGVGIVLYWVGSFVSQSYVPSTQDFNNFINMHNKLNPTDQLERSEFKFFFDYDMKLESTKVALNISF